MSRGSTGEACGGGGSGCGVEAVDLSPGAGVSFGVLTTAASIQGDRDISCGSMVRRQFETISSPNILPKVSTLWKGRGRGAGGEMGEEDSASGDTRDTAAGIPTPGKKQGERMRRKLNGSIISKLFFF